MRNQLSAPLPLIAECLNFEFFECHDKIKISVYLRFIFVFLFPRLSFKITAMMQAEEETGGENADTSAHAHLKQWKREVTLAVNLANILEPFAINEISAEVTLKP